MHRRITQSSREANNRQGTQKESMLRNTCHGERPAKRARKARDPVGPEFLAETRNKVKQMRMKEQRTVTAKEKADIILLVAWLKAKAEEKKADPSMQWPSLNVTREAATVLGRQSNLVSEVWREWCEKGSVKETISQSKRRKKRTVVPRTRQLRRDLCDWIHARNTKHIRTVASDVHAFLKAKGVFGDDCGSKVENQLRTVRTFMAELGFKFGTEGAVESYRQESPSVCTDSPVHLEESPSMSVDGECGSSTGHDGFTGDTHDEDGGPVLDLAWS